MDNYIIELFGGTTIEITEKDYYDVIGVVGLVTLRSCGQTINTAAIRRIVPKKTYEIDCFLENGRQQEGVLHDGTRVTRYFGQWYVEGMVDERGKPEKVIDPQYYPEVMRDCVPTPQEYQIKYEALPREKRLQLMIKGHRDRVSRFVSVTEALENAWKRIDDLHKNENQKKI